MHALDTQTFDLRGSHYSVGFEQGQRTARFEVPVWWPTPPDLDFAQACAEIIASVHPPLIEEMHGYATAQGQAFEELLRGLCRRSMKLRHRAPTYPEGGCSSFARVEAAGYVRVGHNYDFYPIQRVRQRIRLAPEEGRPSVGMRGSVPCGRYDGVNDAALFVALHVVLVDEPDEIAPGVPFHLFPRLALELCANTREAVDLLTSLPHLNAFNYLIADASGEMAVVEAHPARVRVRRPECEGFIAATNHFEHAEMRDLQRGRKLTHSHNRLRALTAGQPLTDDASGLCGHNGGHTTLWSLQADLTAHTLSYTLGQPCQNPYQTVPWPSNN